MRDRMDKNLKEKLFTYCFYSALAIIALVFIGIFIKAQQPDDNYSPSFGDTGNIEDMSDEERTLFQDWKKENN
jgi:hypothetical protein